MKSRAKYFRQRRQRLSRKKLCARCGTEPAKPGHTHCAACLAVKVVKAEISSAEIAKQVKAAKRKRLLAHLDLIEQGRQAVLSKLDVIT